MIHMKLADFARTMSLDVRHIKQCHVCRHLFIIREINKYDNMINDNNRGRKELVVYHSKE